MSCDGKLSFIRDKQIARRTYNLTMQDKFHGFTNVQMMHSIITTQAQIASRASKWHANTKSILRSDTSKYTIENPLIVILGIGEYDTNVMASLIGVSKDYFNIIYCFNQCHKFDCIYYTKHNKFIRLTNISQIEDWDIEYKLRWNYDEIDIFIDVVSEFIQDKTLNYYDGLIFFISSHGDVDNVIYDSTGEEYSLECIFNKFNNHNCVNLCNKPKIYCVDACRGPMTTKRYIKTNTNIISTNDNVKTDDTNINNNNNNNNNSDGSNGKPSIIPKTEKQSVSVKGSPSNSNANTNATSDDNKTKEIEIIGDIVNNTKKVTCDDNIKYVQDSHCRKIFANTSGYAAIDGGKKGGYLIRSIIKVIMNEKTFHKYDLDAIIRLVRQMLENLIGSHAAQVIEDINTMQENIWFKSKSIQLSNYVDDHVDGLQFKLLKDNNNDHDIAETVPKLKKENQEIIINDKFSILPQKHTLAPTDNGGQTNTFAIGSIGNPTFVQWSLLMKTNTSLRSDNHRLLRMILRAEKRFCMMTCCCFIIFACESCLFVFLLLEFCR